MISSTNIIPHNLEREKSIQQIKINHQSSSSSPKTIDLAIHDKNRRKTKIKSKIDNSPALCSSPAFQ